MLMMISLSDLDYGFNSSWNFRLPIYMGWKIQLLIF